MTEQIIRQIIREEIRSALLVKPKSYTIDETCAQLKVTKQTLHRWRKTGVLKVVKVGSRVLVSEDEIKRLTQ